jgi:hypothetical protein
MWMRREHFLSLGESLSRANGLEREKRGKEEMCGDRGEAGQPLIAPGLSELPPPFHTQGIKCLLKMEAAFVNH